MACFFEESAGILLLIFDCILEVGLIYDNIHNLKDMQKNIIIAIDLTDKVKKILSGCQGKIKQRLNKFDIEEFINWIKRDLLNIHLISLGKLSDNEIGVICNEIQKVIENREVFDININKVCFGPKDKDFKFLWTEGEKSQELTDLQRNIENVLNESNNKEESKSFSPHIILGRIKKNNTNNIDFKKLPNIELDLNLSIAIDSVEIMEQVSTKYGFKYNILQSIKLK